MRLTWQWLPHLMWVVRNAVHVGMSAMEDIAHVIVLAIISCQLIIRLHAAIIMHALALSSHVTAEISTQSQCQARRRTKF